MVAAVLENIEIAPDSPLRALAGPPRSPHTREMGLDFYGDLATVSDRLARAIVFSISTRCTERTLPGLAQSLGVDDPNVLRLSLRGDPSKVFGIISFDKLLPALELKPLYSFNNQEGVQGSNRETAEKLHWIFAGQPEKSGLIPPPTFFGIEDITWRNRLLKSPLQSRERPLGVEDLIPLAALAQIEEAYPKIKAAVASAQLK